MGRSIKLSEVTVGSLNSASKIVMINDGRVEQASNLREIITEYISQGIISTISDADIDLMFQ